MKIVLTKVKFEYYCPDCDRTYKSPRERDYKDEQNLLNYGICNVCNNPVRIISKKSQRLLNLEER